MKKVFLVVALVAVLVLSGCVIPTSDSTGIEQSSVFSSQEIPPLDNQQPDDQQPNGQLPPTLPQNIQEPVNQQPDLPLDDADVESCGSIDIANLAMATGSVEEKANLSCFNQNMASCSNSTFEFTGLFGGLFTVLGTQGDTCLISYYDNTDSILKTCTFPKTFIETSVLSAEEANQPEIPLILFSAGMRDKQYINSVTGENIEIECN